MSISLNAVRPYGNGLVLGTYAPNALFSPQSLYWNTGSGFAYTNCLNARGLNAAFANSKDADYYIGSGTPQTTAGTTASALVGSMVGTVSGQYRSQVSNVGNVQSVGVIAYERNITVNNSSYGGVVYPYFVSNYFYTSGSGWTGVSGAPVAVRSSATASAKNSATFVGFFIDGVQVTATSGDIYVSSTNAKLLNIKNTLREDVDVDAVFGLKYTVSYNANGGTGTMNSQTCYYGAEQFKSAKASENSFTPQSGVYSFSGWNTKADGSGVVVAPGSNLSAVYPGVNKTVTLYAQWRFVGFTLTATKSAAVGTLSLKKGNEIVATEASGTLTYTGAADGSAYSLVCTMTDGFALPAQSIAPEEDDELTVVFNIPLYQIELAGGDHGTLSITSPDSPDRTEDGKNYYVTGRSITVQTAAATGFSVTAAYIDEILSGGGYSQIQEVPASAFTNGAFTIPNLSKSIRIRADYEAKICAVSASVDEASASAISGVTVTKIEDGESVPVTSVAYGTQVTFTATMVSGSGCSFEGFYIDGERVSDTSPMTLTITEDTVVVAKAKCAVTLELDFTGEGEHDTVSLKAGDEVYSAPVDVTLGDSLDIAVVFADSSTFHFDHWEKDGLLVALLVEATITPTKNVTYTAYVADVVEKTLKTWLMLIGTPTTKLDSGQYPGVINIVDVTPEEANMPTTLPSEYSTGDDDPEPYEHTRPGMGYVRVTAAPKITVGEGASAEEKNFNCFATALPEEGQQQPPTASVITRELTFTTLLAATETEIYAYYGAAVPVRVGIAYENGLSSRCGEIVITASTDPSAVRNDDGSITSLQGTDLTLVAIPANGWKFVGWFDVPEMGITPVAVGGTYTVVAAQTLYARFEADTAHAVKRWEGSDENKVMVWRSKTYEASKPFNPAACRVDARRYPDAAWTNGAVLELTVDMYSAPDAAAKPTAHTRLPTELQRQGVITSQDARRLPVRRMERYMQVEVKANGEVDALLVGTSMEGLAQ